MTLILNELNNAASPVQSPGTMGGSRAYGSTSYAASSASATVSHALVSTKTAKVLYIICPENTPSVSSFSLPLQFH